MNDILTPTKVDGILPMIFMKELKELGIGIKEAKILLYYACLRKRMQGLTETELDICSLLVKDKDIQSIFDSEATKTAQKQKELKKRYV